MGKLTKEEIVLLFLDNPQKVSSAIWYGNVSKSDEIRTLICDLGDPRCAYRYARDIDKSPHPDTRQAACKDPCYAYFYAIGVDRSPHPDTRKGVCKDPYWKAEYKKWESSLNPAQLPTKLSAKPSPTFQQILWNSMRKLFWNP